MRSRVLTLHVQLTLHNTKLQGKSRNGLSDHGSAVYSLRKYTTIIHDDKRSFRKSWKEEAVVEGRSRRCMSSPSLLVCKHICWWYQQICYRKCVDYLFKWLQGCLSVVKETRLWINFHVRNKPQHSHTEIHFCLKSCLNLLLLYNTCSCTHSNSCTVGILFSMCLF